MGEATGQSVLRRMAEAGRTRAPGGGPVLPARALSLSLARAAASVTSMAMQVASCSERIASLSDLLETLPERGLLALLEGPEETQGIAAFDHGLLSAVIEMQMTGALSPVSPPPRRVTRTDAALAADLIDATLGEFEAALVGREESRWASDFAYASHIEDLRPIGLMLEDVDYRIFGLSVVLGSGTRQGGFVLALPAKGRGPVRMPTDGSPTEAADAADRAWSEALHATVDEGEVRLDAVLHRFRLPLADIGRLQPGDELTLPLIALDRVQLVAAGGQGFGQWRLGQSQGHKAVRLGDGAGPLRGAVPGETQLNRARMEDGPDAFALRDITPGHAAANTRQTAAPREQPARTGQASGKAQTHAQPGADTAAEAELPDDA